MTLGRLVKSKGKYYAVMYWKDPITHQRVEKWISTQLVIHGNSTRAKQILTELKLGFDPNDIVKTNICLMKLGLKPLEDDGRRMKKRKAERIIRMEAKSDLTVEVAQSMQRGLILFSDYMKIWLDKVKPEIRETTYTGYRFNVYHIIAPYFAKKRVYLQDITPEDIESFYREQLKTKNPNTVIRYHANIRKALQYAYKKGFILTNPADRVDRPKKSTYVHTFYNKEETEELLKKVKGTPFEFPVTMAALYGLRREEVVGLKWDAIDFQYKQITIKHTVTEAIVNGKRVEVAADTTKTKKSFRTLPFDPSGIVENMLLDMKAKQDEWKKTFGKLYNYEYDGYIYVRENGTRYKTSWLSSTFKHFLKQNGLRQIRFHDLRHTCATMLRHTGVPMEDIQKFLGHSTITTTEGIYAHFDDTRHKATITMLSDYLTDKTDDDEYGNVVKKEKEADKE